VRTLAKALLLVVAFGGLLAFTQVSHELVFERKFDDERGRYVTEVSGETLEVGLWFCPWFERSKCSTPGCGTMSSQVNALSWSWLALAVSIGGLCAVHRMRSNERLNR
jgi:hypothetical protein